MRRVQCTAQDSIGRGRPDRFPRRSRDRIRLHDVRGRSHLDRLIDRRGHPRAEFAQSSARRGDGPGDDGARANRSCDRSSERQRAAEIGSVGRGGRVSDRVGTGRGGARRSIDRALALDRDERSEITLRSPRSVGSGRRVRAQRGDRAHAGAREARVRRREPRDRREARERDRREEAPEGLRTLLEREGPRRSLAGRPVGRQLTIRGRRIARSVAIV